MTDALVDTPLAKVTRGEGVAVDVRAIERELANMWAHASEHASTVARACLWNLVVRVDDEGHLARVKQTLAEVVRACPSRLLLLHADAEPNAAEQPEVEAELSAHCHLAPGGGKLVCSEEVTLRSHGEGREHLPALVRALLVPDVPAALLSLGAEAGHVRDRELAGLVDRVVVDTGALGALDALVGLAAARWPHLTDLGWLRTEPWRLLWASLFDAPVGGAPLRLAEQVVVVASPGGEAVAGLFLGWLADRLKWRQPRLLRDGARRAWACSNEGGVVVRVALETAENGAAGGSRAHPLAEIRVEGAAGRYQLTYAGNEHVRAEGDLIPTRLLSAPERPDAELLVAALGARGQDPRFGVALRRAAELVA